ncbi:hypothetical protein F2Q68_00045012 [Brassica cretica]|uniref:Uncharacterized protein n=1 Tax=Brassica cretica TaxID=69181 RepID=A0A8S9LMX3_BRACR|nr:hypothetical protein F2Q68_00045012 [Brassica cretica]
MDPSGGVTPPHPSFPSRMFVVGEEPLGIRVTPYHKPSCITKILNASGEDEVRVIMEFPFGKLVEIAEEPSFSGWFGCFLLFRQLKVAFLCRSIVTRRLEITARPHFLVSLSITHLHLVDRNANFNLEDPQLTEKSLPDVDIGDEPMDEDKSRAWEDFVIATRRIPNIDYVVKFGVLSEKLGSTFVINVGDLSLDSRELTAIVERSSHLPSRSIGLKEFENGMTKDVLLDLVKGVTRVTRDQRKQPELEERAGKDTNRFGIKE